MGRLLKDLEAKMRVAALASGAVPLKDEQKSSSLPSLASLTGLGGSTKVAEANSESASIPMILVHSTHDTALAALLSTLDVFDEK